MEDEWLIYRIVFPNGKSYIGLTKDLTKRISRHKKDVNARLHLPVYDAINHFGWDNVRFEVLTSKISTRAKACELEIEYILKYSSYIRDGKGYNATKGGEGAGTISPEALEKFRKAAKERWNNPAYRHKMVNLKRRMDDDVKSRIAQSLKETYSKDGHPWTGRKVSEDTRSKMVTAARSRNAKRIYCSKLDFVFLSITECAIFFEVTKQSIIKGLRTGNTVKYKSLSYYN
jgi:group I intron endonuclease